MFSYHGLERERNRAVLYFLNSTHDYLFFLDTDVILNANSISELILNEKPIVSGLYNILPNAPAVLVQISKRHWVGAKLDDLIKQIHSGLVVVDGVGVGCLLIKREVFDKIKPPYFKFVGKIGEDLYFCEKVRNAGFSIFLNLSVQVVHLKVCALLNEAFRI